MTPLVAHDRCSRLVEVLLGAGFVEKLQTEMISLLSVPSTGEAVFLIRLVFEANA